MGREFAIAAGVTIALWGGAAAAGNGDAPPAPQAAPQSAPQVDPKVVIQPTPGAAAPAPAGAAPKPGTPALVLDTDDYEGVSGKSVRAVNGDDLGRIIDVIIDKEGRPRAAIIDFGGFLGVGSRKIAVDWRVLKFATADGKAGPVTLQLSRNQVRVSPEYKSGEPIVVLGATSPGAAVPGAPNGEPDPAASPAVQPPAIQPPAAAPAAPPPAAPDRPAEKGPE